MKKTGDQDWLSGSFSCTDRMCLIYMPGHDLININGGDNAANKETVREEDHRIIVGDGTAALAYKNETVYVVLNADGTVADQRVVNWIYDMDNKSLNTLVDYGHYTSVTNMKSEKVPVVNDDHVIWDQDSLDEGDIFYEGDHFTGTANRH